MTDAIKTLIGLILLSMVPLPMLYVFLRDYNARERRMREEAAESRRYMEWHRSEIRRLFAEWDRSRCEWVRERKAWHDERR